MIRIECDNCGRELNNKPDEINPSRKPDVRVTLRMEVEGKSNMPIDMDLCIGCARKYIAILKEPI